MGRHFAIKKLNFYIGLYAEVKDEIVRQITLRKSLVVLPCSLNDLASCSLDPNLRSYYEQIDICTTDGVPLVWWVILKSRFRVERVYGPDLTKSILMSTQGISFRHVFCGSSVTTLEKLKEKVLSFAPKLHVVGTISPRIELEETAEEKKSLKRVIDTKPSIIWIGISSPKQVVLASRWKRHFPRATVFCVGAALGLISGEIPVAPEWMQYLGLEWLFRLLVEPRRLYKRYLFIIPKFLLQETLIWLKDYFSF